MRGALPHSSTVLPSRTAQRSYPPTQLNGPTLPSSILVIFHFGCLPFGVICNLFDLIPPAQLNGTTLPHSSTVLSSRTAQRLFTVAPPVCVAKYSTKLVVGRVLTFLWYSPPAQLNGPILPHNSTVLTVLPPPIWWPNTQLQKGGPQTDGIAVY